MKFALFSVILTLVSGLFAQKLSPDSLRTGTDSLRAGIKVDTALAISRKNSISPVFGFMIPIIGEFEKLRSQEENRAVSDHMDQDAENRFDENDICFPVGLVYGRAINTWIQVRAGACFFSTSNSNTWTPRKGDTTRTENFVNSYSLQALNVSFETQFNISRALVTVDNFNRLYFTVMGEYFPLVNLKTERTELNKRIKSTGRGWGQGVCLGIERYLNEWSSFTGEIGYTLSTLENFKSDVPVKVSDIFLNGRDTTFSLYLKSLKFRFLYSRWF